MKTIVITGGTSGLGQVLARAYLERGERVVVVSRDAGKGEEYLRRAEQDGHGGRAFFYAADLSLVSENQRVVAEIKSAFPVVDALVLCARFFRSYRRVTSEGIEHHLALFSLSRYLAGPGNHMARIHWDDLELERGYDGWEAMFQGGRLNDLLGVHFDTEHQERGIRYVLLFPGNIAGRFVGEFDPVMTVRAEAMRRAGTPIEGGVRLVSALIDSPPSETLSAFQERRPISVRGGTFDPDDAKRLHGITQGLIQRAGQGALQSLPALPTEREALIVPRSEGSFHAHSIRLHHPRHHTGCGRRGGRYR
ncbi:SDR family NAD(P)-dependent oxidoreductase [Streptomyces sp. ME19-01-6]|uniref:SDR family NAD(P)-dependent oxidoreductase n=1 Tax=Streptomyces sp. ME19-01-6 TaxID=3028686 RepID=UPI0029A7A439|nr:SDR family NAD(P)-dependent oxidoreductase [Streptomyces sp. ME19-01-6]MDX3226161.1 SDR family NAD(P)-dependent oxidoreductase [Streptomyces sp. ME19-01-6]